NVIWPDPRLFRVRPPNVIRPARLFRVSPHVQAMAVIMVPDKRQAEMKRSQMEPKGRGWRGGENNGRECGNPKNSADLSHDPAPQQILNGWHLKSRNTH